MKIGRPTLYDPALCEEAEAFLAQGHSLTALAGKFGVCYSTIKTWQRAHPEFQEAVKRGQAGAVLWWEERAREMAMGGDGNATMIIFGLKNRAREEWKDAIRQEQSGPDGAPVEQTITVEFVNANRQDS